MNGTKGIKQYTYRTFVGEAKGSQWWSNAIMIEFGTWAAALFAQGAALYADKIEETLEWLAEKPPKTNIGQTIIGNALGLPEQFMSNYDIAFVTKLRDTLSNLRRRIKDGELPVAHSAAEELLIYLCTLDGYSYLEVVGGYVPAAAKDAKTWMFDLFDDSDVTFLYTDPELTQVKGSPYYVENWFRNEFFMGLSYPYV